MDRCGITVQKSHGPLREKSPSRASIRDYPFDRLPEDSRLSEMRLYYRIVGRQAISRLCEAVCECRTRLGSFFQMGLSSQPLLRRAARDGINRAGSQALCAAPPASFRPVAAPLWRHEGGMTIRISLIVPRGTIYKISYVPGGKGVNSCPIFAGLARRARRSSAMLAASGCGPATRRLRSAPPG